MLLVVIAGLLLLIVFTGEGREQLTPLEDLLLTLFAPAQTVFSSAGQKLQSFFDAIVSFYELKAENDRCAHCFGRVPWFTVSDCSLIFTAGHHAGSLTGKIF